MNEMSLRDQLAATVSSEFIETMKLSVFICEQLVGRKFPGWDNPKEALKWKAEVRAELRYMEADAMLESREKCDGEG